MNTETFTHFDPSTHLNTVEDVAAYLEAIIEESDDDPTVIAHALSEIARQAGISREGLYKALSPNGNPTLATVIKVSRALGLRLHFEAVA